MIIIRLFTFIFSIVFILIGSIILGIIAYDLNKSYLASDWIPTNGTIINSSYTSDISYTYQINGKKYLGNSINFSTLNLTNNYSKVKNDSKGYTIGESVEVFYNPDNLSESVLTKNIPNVYLKSIIGLSLFIFGFFLL